MATLILSTKVQIPPLRAGLVPRLRLFDRLAVGLLRKLILVSAPAGFGKTTLLLSWLDRERREDSISVAWLALDHEDSAPVRFWTYLIHALQSAAPGLGTRALEMLEVSEQPSIEAVLTVLLNEINAWNKPLLLALDDYHLVESTAVQDGMVFFLEHMPPRFHLAVITRIDPPWPMARLRAQYSILEVRQHDLRFTPEEAAAFLQESMQLRLTAEDVTSLDAHTEGWIAGLQMAALSLQQQLNPREFIMAFIHNDRYIFDYLLEEVLQKQTPMVQGFLLKTAILDRMSAPLCDAVLQCGSSQDILDYLERANLFLTPLDHERRWYRYHHLFVQLLQNYGNRCGLDATLYHRRASTWLAANDLPAAALRHALQAGDFEQAARIAEDNALVMLGQGHLGTLSAWLETLPASLTQARPWLCVSQAWLAVYAGKVEATTHWLARAEALFASGDQTTNDDETRRLIGSLAVIRSILVGLRNDHAHIVPLAQQALDYLPLEDWMERAMAYTQLGIGLRHHGQFDAAETALDQAVVLAETQGMNQATIYAQCHQASLHQWRGQLRRAGDEFRQIIRAAREAEVASSMIALAYQAFSHIAYEHNALEEALEATRQGLALAEQWGHGEFILSGYVDLAEVLLACGDATGALDAMARAKQMCGEMVWPSWLEALEIKMQGIAGNAAVVSKWARDFEARKATVALRVQTTSIHLSLARAWVSEGRTNDARQLLQQVWEIVGPTERVGRKLETLALMALAEAAGQRMPRAVEMLEEALALAEPEGYVRVFLNEDTDMVALLQAVPIYSHCHQYARHLLAEFARTDAARYPMPVVEEVDPLSPRELEVLRLLASSMDVTQIAGHLTIAVSTARTHIRSIYAKLGVNHRMEAVQRGKELGLL